MQRLNSKETLKHVLSRIKSSIFLLGKKMERMLGIAGILLGILRIILVPIAKFSCKR